MEMKKELTARGNVSRLPMPGRGGKRQRSPTQEMVGDESAGKKSKLDNAPTPASIPVASRSISSKIQTSKPSYQMMQKTASSSNLMKKPSAAPVVNKNSRTVLAPRTANPRLNAASTTLRGKSTTGTLKSAQSTSNLNSTIVSTGAPKKRPAWDLKGRMQDMEAHMQKQEKDRSTLHSQLSDTNSRVAQLESLNKQLSCDVEEKQMARETAVQEIQDLKSKLSDVEQEFLTKKRTLERTVEDLEFQKSSLERQKTSLEDELSASLKEIGGLKATIAEMTASYSSQKAEIENLKVLLEKARDEIAANRETIHCRDTLIGEQKSTIEEYCVKEMAHETERRKLHNCIQELKGNIRVFCRVRPLLGDELLGSDGEIQHMTFPDMDHKILELDRLSELSVNESVLNSTRGGRPSANKYEFSFDRVFEPTSTQEDVFDEISQLVQSALDGYNVCIFAYGQTGSGKTFTMEGALENEDTLGMIPRAVKQIFTTAAQLEQKGWKYTFHANMLEIYNETIRDLLGKGGKEKCEIKMVGKSNNEVYVTNLTVEEVKTENKVFKLLKKASENRAVAETKCNEHSSRSHSVFQLKLEGINSATSETCKGSLNLVDLAGSERIKDSGSEGQRLVEAQSINKSLSNLGNVIMALGNKEKHIPYRNSKLTYLLQNSLGGNSKTLMFVNVSPKEECSAESLNSLRFATKVNQCNIGTAQKKK